MKTELISRILPLDFARTLLLIFHILSAFQQIAVDMQSWRRLIEVFLMNEFLDLINSSSYEPQTTQLVFKNYFWKSNLEVLIINV
jgi:hypothetical protein